MIISTLKEAQGETRIAITPHTAKNFIKQGFQIGIEQNAGHASGFSDQAYGDIGVEIIKDRKSLLKKTNILLCINEPNPSHLDGLPSHSLIIGHIDNEPESALVQWCIAHQISLFSMNLIPRISRAQSMDSLSSQANLAGYRAVLEAANHFNKVIPMMMTAAGMIQPAKVLILGAGVAGLQAIATAKRLGAVVYAFDVRRAAKEQVESLGAEFIEVSPDQDSESQSGYATEMSEEYKKKQSDLIDQFAKQSDIVISTALIPGRKAPVLLTRQTVEQMKPGSVIIDLATSRGGNCELSVHEKTIIHNEVIIIGSGNMQGKVSKTASDLYANNLLHLIQLIAPQPTEIQLNREDQIIQQALLCHKGGYLPFQSAEEKQNA